MECVQENNSKCQNFGHNKSALNLSLKLLPSGVCNCDDYKISWEQCVKTALKWLRLKHWLLTIDLRMWKRKEKHNREYTCNSQTFAEDHLDRKTTIFFQGIHSLEFYP